MTAVKRLAGVLVGIAVLVMAGLTAFGWAQRPDVRVPPGVAGRRLLVDGTPIRYVQGGSGPDILLVHGSPGSVEDWEPVFEPLSRRFRVTAFDRPGHGYSGGAERPHTPGDNADVARGLIHVLGLKDVVFVGHSFGGAIALDLAIRNPEEVRTFVVVGTRAYGPVAVEGLYRALAVPVFGRGLAAALAPWAGPGRMEAGIRASFGPNADAIPPDFVERRAPIWMRPTVTAALSEERVRLGEALEAMAPRYAEIRKPLVIVCGEQDRNHEDALRLAREIPGARLVVLPDTGHYVQYARPHELVAVIEEAATAARAVAAAAR